MLTVKTRIALKGGRYLATHPRSWLTRVVVRFAIRRLTGKLAGVTHAEAIPATRGSRLTTVAGVAAVAGGIILVVRRAAASPNVTETAVTVPPPFAPFPAAAGAAAPPETRDAPPTSPTTSPAAEAAAADVGEGDDALVVRVRSELFGGTPPLGVTVESHSGVITLRGRVADLDAESRFVRDAEAIDGVKAVQSELQHATAEPGPPAS